MSHRYTLSLSDELDKRLSAHPMAKQYKTPTAFLRFIAEDFLIRNSNELLKAIQALLTKAEMNYIAEQHEKEAYNYDVVKQFKRDAEPARTLLEITKEIYIMKRNVFKELALPTIEELESKL